jgi:hypothetical protein
MPVANAFYSSYSEDRDQEDRDLKVAWANSLRKKNPSHTKKKRLVGVAQSVRVQL